MAALLICVMAADCRAEIARPRSGKTFPPEIRELIESQKPFLMNRRWLESRNNVRQEYTSYDAAGMELPESGALTGTLYVPSLMMLYENTPYQPVQTGLLQRELFDGPWETGTMAEYFNEVSRGLFGVSGDVPGWFQLAEEEAYYSGGFGSWGLDLENSRTGELIAEAVMLADPGIDFGLYDNDGPDQVPNSGDDDGYVDIIFLITPTMGAECDFFSSHFWSHSGSYESLWSENGESVVTGDPAAGGGYIKVDDYILAPSISCNPFSSAANQEKLTGTVSSELDTLIEIGLFCHELAHALGLPDLYDTDVSRGIGYWGLMGFGELNTPESPAHMSAYSKEKLGWAEVINVGLEDCTIRLDPVFRSGRVVRMTVPDQRFRRVYCLGGYALVCGLNLSEATARGWPAGGGYGNMWEEKVGREFRSNGTGSCILEYEVSSDTDSGDYGCVMIKNGDSTDTLAVYSGLTIDRVESFDLSGYLNSSTDAFLVSFCFFSGYSSSDEDGGFDSDWCGTFRIDNVSVTGRGIDYSSDLEDDDGGWKYLSRGNEYFLAEYRVREGFDSYLPGEGLLVWHVDDALARSVLGNSGGVDNQQARGVVLEEADGRFDLLQGSFGEQSDPFPGSTGKTSFSNMTSPGSVSNSGKATDVYIDNISVGKDNGGRFVEADFRGGEPDSVISVSSNGLIGYVDVSNGYYFIKLKWNILGDGPYRSLLFRKKAGGWDDFELITPDTIRSKTGIFRYTDYALQQGELYLYRLMAFNRLGSEDITVGGNYAVYDYNITGRRAGFISSYPNPFNKDITITFHLPENPVARITIFDVEGRRIDRIGPGRYQLGYNSITYVPDPNRVTSGVYLCLLQSGDASDVIKIVFLK